MPPLGFSFQYFYLNLKNYVCEVLLTRVSKKDIIYSSRQIGSYMKKRVTSSDVAKEAGVSRATVSYILNNTEGSRISRETRQKVLKAAKKLGYHMDINAQAMKTNRSMSIGVVSRRNIAESRFTNVLGGIKEVLSQKKYSILLCSDEVDEMGIPEYYRLYRSKKIDGIIFISYQEQMVIERADERAERMLAEQIPCVFADYHLKNPMVNCVDINYFHGAYIVTKYLLEKGYKKVAFLVPDLDTEQERQRMQGVNRAVEEVNNVSLTVYRISRQAAGFTNDIVNVLENMERFDAVILAWASLAAFALYHTNRMKIKVPEEIAVISLAYEQAARYTFPHLTACDLPLFEVGQKSAEILIEQINGNDDMPVSIALPCRLKIGESC